MAAGGMNSLIRSAEGGGKDAAAGGIGLSFVLPALLCAFVAATPGSAFAPEFSTRETRAVTHAYAKCVVGRRHRKASEALLRNVDNSTILREYRMLIVGDCLVKQVRESATMRFEGDLYRYALADALVNRELATLDMPDLSAMPRLDHRHPGEPPQRVTPSGKKLGRRKYEAAVRDYEEAAGFFYLSRYGECVVRVAPREAKALLLTTPDSSEETARFAALQPALGTCLAEGNTLKFGRVALRGTIAINYYRLAQGAARAPATGTAGGE
jgi:hypothetical protein